MENDDRILARLDGHMAEGNQIMRENRRAFEDLRQFLGEMAEVLQALVRQINQNSAEVGEHREESREQWQELREEMREEGRESREQWQQTREELLREFQEEARALREEFRMQRSALIAILDQLRGEGPGAAPAT
ncbi:MAG: hypothetical protein M3459_11910 [Actinomycetota bacterium]|nr:hypothetical protein [Actinomycetota bacterium]